MYLSRRRPGHSQALLEVEESHEDDGRRLQLRENEEGVRKDAASQTQRSTRVHTHTAYEPRTRTQKDSRAQPPPQPCSPPRLPAFKATIKLAESRADTPAKRRP